MQALARNPWVYDSREGRYVWVDMFDSAQDAYGRNEDWHESGTDSAGSDPYGR